jgi:hypothetical protein
MLPQFRIDVLSVGALPWCHDELLGGTVSVMEDSDIDGFRT